MRRHNTIKRKHISLVGDKICSANFSGDNVKKKKWHRPQRSMQLKDRPPPEIPDFYEPTTKISETGVKECALKLTIRYAWWMRMLYTYMDGTCMQFQWIWPSPGMDRCSLFVTMLKIYNASFFGKLPPQSATAHTEKEKTEQKEREKKISRRKKSHCDKGKKKSGNILNKLRMYR